MLHDTKKLNNRQEDAVRHPGGPLLIAAGAGSGKTHTLASRIRYLTNELRIPPHRILAITFTNKAADEMKRRISAPPGLFIGTFHSFGARLLRNEAQRFGRTNGFTIFDSDDSLALIKRAVKNRNLPKEKYMPPAVHTIISKIKNELSVPEKDDEIMTGIFNDYETALSNNNAFDFDDLIEKPVRFLEADAAARTEYQQRYDHVLVDEYQDINTAQYRLVRLLTETHKNLSVVGDDAQSIYAFRGADFRNFLNFERDWPHAKIVLLEENYRSTPTILEAANAIIQNNIHQKQKNLWTNNNDGEPIEVYPATDEGDEAEWVVKQIIKLSSSQDDNLENIAILYRTNAQSRALEQTLIAAGIPYRIFGGVRFYERKEIKDIVAGIRLAHNPRDTVSAERIEKNFSKGKSRLLLDALPRLEKQLTVTQIIDYFIHNTQYIDYLKNNYQNAQDRLENVQGLIAFAFTFEEKGVAAFLEQVSLAQSHDNPQGNRGVNLMTIHLSKGLEFKYVFITGVGEGTLPHHRSYARPEEMEEERRLMYVAVTRAAERLFLSFANIPSRFLSEIPGNLLTLASKKKDFRKKQFIADDEELWLEYD